MAFVPPSKIFTPASQHEAGTVAERLSKARQEREAKSAFAAKLTAAPKRSNRDQPNRDARRAL